MHHFTLQTPTKRSANSYKTQCYLLLFAKFLVAFCDFKNTQILHKPLLFNHLSVNSHD